MSGALLNAHGHRKYLVANERLAYIRTASLREIHEATFLLAMIITGARISEVLALTHNRIDVGENAIVFETLKRRNKKVFRSVPVPDDFVRLALLVHIDKINIGNEARLWSWRRTTAWKLIKEVMIASDIPPTLCMPRALRHTFAVHSIQHGIPITLVQRWLGHARLETTAIYASVTGEEERAIAARSWTSLRESFNGLLSAVVRDN
jgi:integrase/recombinase XerD